MPHQHPEDSEHPEATEDIRARMRLGLVDAMKARDQRAVAALRSALARIDNAEAVDADGFDDEEQDAEPFGADGFGDEAVDGDVALDAGDGHPALYRGDRRPVVAGGVVGVGAAEVDRRVLTPAQMAAIVRDDVEEREIAADLLERRRGWRRCPLDPRYASGR